MDAKHLAVPVEVDKPRLLCIDFNTLCEAEKECGINFLLGMNMPMSYHGMRAICWASWKRDDPTLTVEQVGIILQDHWPHVMERLMEAWLLAMPESEEGEGKADKASDPTEAITTAPS
jgi:hypothetical protein